MAAEYVRSVEVEFCPESLGILYFLIIVAYWATDCPFGRKISQTGLHIVANRERSRILKRLYNRSPYAEFKTSRGRMLHTMPLPFALA